MGVAKLAAQPNMTATAKGRASTPIVAAISNAIGVKSRATALLLISSVRNVASRYMTDSVARGPKWPTAPVTPLAIRWAAPVFSMAAAGGYRFADFPKIGAPLNLI